MFTWGPSTLRGSGESWSRTRTTGTPQRILGMQCTHKQSLRIASGPRRSSRRRLSGWPEVPVGHQGKAQEAVGVASWQTKKGRWASPETKAVPLPRRNARKWKIPRTSRSTMEPFGPTTNVEQRSARSGTKGDVVCLSHNPSARLEDRINVQHVWGLTWPRTARTESDPKGRQAPKHPGGLAVAKRVHKLIWKGEATSLGIPQRKVSQLTNVVRSEVTEWETHQKKRGRRSPGSERGRRAPSLRRQSGKLSHLRRHLVPPQIDIDPGGRRHCMESGPTSRMRRTQGQDACTFSLDPNVKAISPNNWLERVGLCVR